MKALSIIIISLFLYIHPVFASISVIDDDQQQIILNKPATRIISLAPNITEILFAIGAGNKMIGTSVNSDYPAAAKNIPVISDATHIQLENMIALHPDLIIAWKGMSTAGDIDKLRQLKIPVYLTHFSSLDDIPRTMQNLGKLIATEKTANQAAQLFQQQMANLKNKYSPLKKISVFYIIWQDPIFTINQYSAINEVINLCGGSNVFANTIGLAPEVNIESVLAANPQVMIGGYNNNDWQTKWNAWPQLTAVKHHYLFSIAPDLLQRFSPRLILGAKMVCDDLANARSNLTALQNAKTQKNKIV